MFPKGFCPGLGDKGLKAILLARAAAPLEHFGGGLGWSVCWVGTVCLSCLSVVSVFPLACYSHCDASKRDASL